jgi:hypothetical protein
MELVRKYRNRGWAYSSDFTLSIPLWEKSFRPVDDDDIIVVNKTLYGLEHMEYFNKIKDDHVENGRYMIKRQKLKYGNGWEMIAHEKTYLCTYNTFTYDRKDSGIFYLNNFNKIKTLARYIASQSSNSNELISIVDRKDSGREIFFVRYNNRPNSKLIVK